MKEKRETLYKIKDLIKSKHSKSDGIGRVIGVVGTSSGCGSTYISLMVANSLKKLGARKVVCVDMSGRKDYLKIGNGSEDICDNFRCFSFKDISYCCKGNSDDLIELFNEDYEHIVVDFGNKFGNHMKELMRCDIKLVVGLVSSWKISDFERYLKDNEESMKRGKWRYIFNLASDVKVKKLRSKYRIKAVNVEYEEEFYDVKQKNFERIIALLEG